MEEYIAKTMRLKILFIQQIAKNLKIKRANPAKKDLPFMKNDITEHCKECVGFNTAEVRRCTATLCPLFPFRTHDTPEDTIEVPT